MPRLVRVLALALLALVMVTTLGAAQATKFFYLGGGATIPTGDFKDFGAGDGAKTGFMADVGIGTSVGSSGRVFAFADVFYGKNNHDTADESTTLTGGGVNIGIQSSGTAARVYGYVGAGLQSHKYNPAAGESDSETKGFGRGAVGVSLGSGKTTFWAEIGMVQGFGADDGNTTYLPLLAGVSIGW